MKKIFVDAYLGLNLGDDLFLKILFDRYNNVQWYLNTDDIRYRKLFSNYTNVIIKNNLVEKVLRKFRLEIASYKKYDAGILIGGSVFMQNHTWKSNYRNSSKLINSFNEQNKPYFIIGCNFGPYKDKKFIELYKNLFLKCTDVCFREIFSYNLFSNLKNIRIAPDVVFQLKCSNIKKVKNSIGISIINLKNRKDLDIYENEYKVKIKEIVQLLIDNGKEVTFFSFCKQEGDMEAIEAIMNKIDNKYKHLVKVVSYEGNMDKFLSVFETMENIIGSRFHSCILSQVFQQGIYPIIYSDKTYNMLKDIGLNNEYIYIKEIDSLNPKHVLEVINNNKVNNTSIFLESEKQFKELDKYING